jgi:hypothetical protein
LTADEQPILSGSRHHSRNVNRERALSLETNGHVVVRSELDLPFPVKGDHTLGNLNWLALAEADHANILNSNRYDETWSDRC